MSKKWVKIVAEMLMALASFVGGAQDGQAEMADDVLMAKVERTSQIQAANAEVRGKESEAWVI